MLHMKEGHWAHWAVRISRASGRITHVAAGPILRNQDYRNEVGCHPGGAPLTVALQEAA